MFAASALAPAAFAQQQTTLKTAGDLSELSIEELANVEITTVSRRAEPLSQAPAAVFVISREDIRRSGALSLPEALRLAPNLQVARIDAAQYAITARGFNHSTGTANKLQVLVDGRSVYTPLYSGVFWDEQNLLLADVERIEIVSGPGGTLWGANAVNGVINVITREASETTGLLADVGYGDRNTSLSLRYGTRLGENGAMRVYGQGFRRGPSDTPTGADAPDEWGNLQGGFRADWSYASDTITVQGDLYRSTFEDVPATVFDSENRGANLLGRWTHRFGDGSASEIQARYDRTRRDTITGIVAEVDTYALDTQYTFSLGSRNDMVLGGGYRVTDDQFVRGPGTSYLDPEERQLDLWHIYFQDTYALTDRLDVTAGLKVEHNDYTGIEYMPNAVLAWRPGDATLVWGAISRAARTPARFDRDLINPGLVAGGPDFESEYVTAYELGYRMQPNAQSTFSISAFYNEYDDLRTAERTPALGFPLTVSNQMSGQTYGVEAWGSYALQDWWRVSAGLSTLHKDLALDADSRDPFGPSFAGNDPAFQWTLRSQFNLFRSGELDLSFRYVDELPSPSIPDYLEMDLRFGWRLADNLELSIAGYNLLDESHAEFSAARLVPRSAYASLRWTD